MRLIPCTTLPILLAALAVVPAARADDMLAPGSQRTVSWYAKNTAARERVLTICRDDPGAARGQRDCINAEAASISAAATKGARQAGIANWRMSPRTPAYWRNASVFDLQNQLAYCSRMNAQQQAENNCAAAQAGASGR